jgi:Ca-activated chloride channel homolog
MRFENPLALLYILWAFPALVLFFLVCRKRKIKAMNALIDNSLWHEIAPSDINRRDRISIGLLIISILLLLAAFSRPQIGFRWSESEREGVDIIFAIDVSNSMLAEDIMPSRLERVKIEIETMINKMSGSRLGIVAFAGEAFLQCPLTLDYDGFRAVLLDLDTGTIPTGGTSIGKALFKAIESFEAGPVKYRLIILVTDGEEHDESAVNAISLAKKSGIKVFCIGVGTPAGAHIPIMDKTGQKKLMKDEKGRTVLSKLNEDILKQAAFDTGGSYIRSDPVSFGLDALYSQKISGMEKKQIKAERSKQYNEYFQVLIIFAIACLILEMFVSRKKL